MKHTVSEQALALVERELKQSRGTLSPQDAAAATGLTVTEAQDALTRLMELYVTRVSTNEEGRILFSFEMPLRGRGTKTLAEKWASVREAFWRGFKVFYKIWIAVMLIGYFIVSAVLLILLMVAASRAGGDDDDGPGIGGNLLAGVFRAFLEGLQFAFWTRAYGGPVMVDSHGYHYREARVPGGVRKKKEKSFMIAVYDFALGPERPEIDPLENEKEAAAFIRAEGGVLTPTEVLALSGGSYDVAEERMADYMARFGGEPRITDEGVVVGEFEDFLRRSSEEHPEGEIVPFWEEYEAPYRVTGNSAGRNMAIGFMAMITLLGGAMLGPGEGLGELAAVYHPFYGTGLAEFVLGWVPLFFGLSYLLLPLIRLPLVRRQERQRLERNRRKQMMHAIFQHGLFHTTPRQVYEVLPSKTREELGEEGVRNELEKLLPILQGSIELDEAGEPVYTFPRLEREYRTAGQLRLEG